MYGITIEEKQVLFELQEKKCPICLKCFSRLSEAYVDHNHNTGAVRGLLCQQCNAGIGLLQDSCEVVTRAASYLIAADIVPFKDTRKRKSLST
jgi:hypothetical protein